MKQEEFDKFLTNKKYRKVKKMESRALNDSKINVFSLPSLFLLKAQLNYECIKKLDNYLEELKINKNRKSHAKALAGQIKKGQQLKVDHNNENVKDLSDALCLLAKKYVDYFNTNTGSVATEKFSEIDSMWSVYSYEGDYNPVHSHMCKTLTGVCAVTWTKIPESISNVSITEKEDTHNNNGLDGHFSIHYGRTTLMDAETLRPPQESNIVPKVGDIYMFPAWLQHVVYPFNGEGERVTVAANINMWNKNEETK
jgi:hypothetical protein